MSDMAANKIPVSQTKNPRRFVVISFNMTTIDMFADKIIHANTQIVMTKVMEKLEMPIPKFLVRRWAEVKLKGQEIIVDGVDEEGQVVDIFKTVRAQFMKNVDN